MLIISLSSFICRKDKNLSVKDFTVGALKGNTTVKITGYSLKLQDLVCLNYSLIVSFQWKKMSKRKKNNDLELVCICHYPGKSTYSKEVKELTENNITRLIQAKEKRKELGGDHLHQEQIKQIPETFDLQKHGIHSTPCYNL